jgi:hypothetical protein
MITSQSTSTSYWGIFLNSIAEEIQGLDLGLQKSIAEEGRSVYE